MMNLGNDEWWMMNLVNDEWWLMSDEFQLMKNVKCKIKNELTDLV